MVYVIITLSAILAATGQILLKLGAANKTSLVEFLNLYSFLGCLCYGIGLLLWIFSLSKLPLSVAYAFTLVTFVLVFLLSKLWLHEPLSWLAIVGIGLIVAGFICIGIGQSH